MNIHDKYHVAKFSVALATSRLYNDDDFVGFYGNRRCFCYSSRFVSCSQGSEFIRISRFCKEGKEGKFISFLHEDTLTVYDGFRRGAKESSKSESNAS